MPRVFETQNSPTILVVFGATGDLMKKKIIPSVSHLHTHQKLPQMFRVIGMARRDMSDDQFRRTVRATLHDAVPDMTKKEEDTIAEYFHYRSGYFKDVASFRQLKSELENIDADLGVCSNKLFYLAVPPEHFAPIFKNMAAVGLNTPCGGALGWTRMLIEKPFGESYPSAQKLFALLKTYFRDEQMYLIDHYLAKEITQAILHFRFSNNLFVRSWSNKTVERIEVRLLETIGVEDRGAFYDTVGTLRDVGQNHLLQLLAAIIMEAPRDFSEKQLRHQRAVSMEMIKPWRIADIKTHTFRAQYNGFRAIEGVSEHSQTETYFKLETEFLLPEWRGVPIVFEAGKRCPESKKEIIVTFKHPPLCVACVPGEHIHNRVVFSLSPNDNISIHFWTKKPGFDTKLEERTLDFFLYQRIAKAEYVEEYAKLIFDCLRGDQSRFVSEREVLAEWRFADPLVSAWKHNKVPLAVYSPDTDEMIRASVAIGALSKPHEIKKELAIVGLGKMGANMARRMMDHGWRVVGYNKSPEATKELISEGLVPAYSLEEAVRTLGKKKIIWLMIPAGKPVDDVLFGKNGLAAFLKHGDIVIDGGNSFYKDTVRREKKLRRLGVLLLDCGTSGGPKGARRGACLMIGGKKKDFEEIELLFRDFADEDAYQFFEGSGAGHFVKMIHNGIEYGMMQAIAEGFTILKKSTFHLDLTRVADVYNHGSVIESRLVCWLKDAFERSGEQLASISGSADQTGEGTWTVKTAHEMGVRDTVIHEALRFRNRSRKHPSFTGKVISALRGQFGGHAVGKKHGTATGNRTPVTRMKT